MQLSVTASLILTFGLIYSVNSLLSVSPEDFEGSGYDLDSSGSGSGSGDGSDPVETESITVQTNSKDVRLRQVNAGGGGSKNTLHGSSGVTFDSTPWPPADSEFVFIGSTKRFWEQDDIRTAIIAGGVTGAILAVMVMAMLIYQMQHKDEERPVLARKKDSDEGYHKPNRKVII